MKLESKRWFLLAAAVVMNMCIGSGYAWSVFAKPLMQTFSWSPADVAFTFTLTLGIAPLPMIVVGKIQQRLKAKTVILITSLFFAVGVFATGYVQSVTQLYITYGVLAGLGIGGLYGVNVANTMRFFPDKRGLCAGLLAAGFGSGALVVAPIAAKLIIFFGVLSTFKILGLSFAVICITLSMLSFSAPPEYVPAGWTPNQQVSQNSNVDKHWTKMLKDPIFYLIAAMFICGTLAGLMIIAHASPIFQEVAQLSPTVAAVYVGVLGFANTGGRLIWGAISDKLGRLNTMVTMYVIAGIATFGLTIVPHNYIFIAMVMVVGFCFGGFMAMIASITADKFGAKNLPINFGIMFLAFSVAAYFGPRIGVVLKAANNGSYAQAFIVASVITAGGIVIALITKAYEKSTKTRNDTTEAAA